MRLTPQSLTSPKSQDDERRQDSSLILYTKPQQVEVGHHFPRVDLRISEQFIDCSILQIRLQMLTAVQRSTADGESDPRPSSCSLRIKQV